MKKIILLLVVCVGLAGCQTVDRPAKIYGGEDTPKKKLSDGESEWVVFFGQLFGGYFTGK